MSKAGKTMAESIVLTEVGQGEPGDADGGLLDSVAQRTEKP
ncbi:hypothetical protein CVCC1112_1504 [Paenarthrobacter nicotinovorans]|nr:hypothetical protein ANMWB30_22400 [Arthrobacter sp. MWB30]GAT86845.1 hypothetical protein CVCC1112_1504 [Paenarthrobacter nicotinovorans]